MIDQQWKTLKVNSHPQWVEVILNRPKARNAMSFEMVEELRSLFSLFDDQVQAVVLKGAEGHFCAGGDIKDMAGLLQGSKQSKSTEVHDHTLSSSVEHNPIARANRQFGLLLNEIQHASPMVIVLLEGSVMGGGFGLACVADLALATSSVRFALPEVTLGITPAQIAPFVVQRIGLNHTRRLALTGHRFKGPEALRLNLIHELYETPQEMETALDRYLKALSRCNPQARRTTKKLLLNVGQCPLDDLLDQAALDFAHHAQDPQAQAGMMAKIMKKPTPWENNWTFFPSTSTSSNLDSTQQDQNS